MRGEVKNRSEILCLLSLEQRVPADHPLRLIQKNAEADLTEEPWDHPPFGKCLALAVDHEVRKFFFEDTCCGYLVHAVDVN